MVMVVPPPPCPPRWGPLRVGGLLNGAATRASGGGADHQCLRMCRPHVSPTRGGGTWRAATVMIWRWVAVHNGGRSSVAAWASAAVASVVEDAKCVTNQHWRSLRWDVGRHAGGGLCGKGLLLGARWWGVAAFLAFAEVSLD
jgi:hypothetical protein